MQEHKFYILIFFIIFKCCVYCHNYGYLQILIFSATKRYIVGFACKVYNHNGLKVRKKKQYIKQKKQDKYHLIKTKMIITEAPEIFQVLPI